MTKINFKEKLPTIHWVTILFNLTLFIIFVAFSISTKAEIFIIALIIITILFAFIKSQERALINLIYFVVILFMLGQRTMYIGQYIRFSPSESLVLYLFCMLIITGKRPQRHLANWFTAPGVFFIFFVCFGLFTASQMPDRDINIALSYFNYLVFCLPAFYVLHCLVKETGIIRKIVLFFVFTALFASILGLAEYFRLGVTSLFPGYFNFESYVTGDEYPRAMAGFWGGPILAAYLVLTLPLAVSAFYVFRGKTALRWMVIVSFVTSTLFI
ncbi:MAG: hypothetical protein PHQ96_04305, partial [Candidatus Omnitrophica bacterium]|nr:hypothetical protein [Candidatus Omnitrophota bacterium]